MKSTKLPVIIVTGASGFIGKHFLELVKEDYIIYAIARRTMQEVRIEAHKNIKWFLVDIGEYKLLSEIIWTIQKEKKVDYILHLAAYFDFTNKDHPEYHRTNVLGTKHMVDIAKSLNVSRFIFASSVAACIFPPTGESIDEKTPLNADFPYAVTKREGEKMCRELSDDVPCSIVRFAAAFSDWCEYGPLFMFLKTWFSTSWNSKILGGKGESSVPYIHVQCLVQLLLNIIKTSDTLPKYDTYIASPNGATTHNELFKLSTRLFYGYNIRPFHMPKFLSTIGIYTWYFFGKLFKHPPFERPWMMRYIDKQLTVDSTYTQKTLNWEPNSRRKIERRILYLIEHLKSYPVEWQRRNMIALGKLTIDRPHLHIAETMQRLNESIVQTILYKMHSPANYDIFPNYQKMEPDSLEWYIRIYYNLLMASVRTGDRMSLVNYYRFLANIRHSEGFTHEEITSALELIREYLHSVLLNEPALIHFKILIHDVIGLTIQLAIDEIEDSYERIELTQKRI